MPSEGSTGFRISRGTLVQRCAAKPSHQLLIVSAACCVGGVGSDTVHRLIVGVQASDSFSATSMTRRRRKRSDADGLQKPPPGPAAEHQSGSARAEDKLPELPPEVMQVVATATLAACDNSVSAWLRLRTVSRIWWQALGGASCLCLMTLKRRQVRPTSVQMLCAE